nr:radical SAM protein [Desulfurispira natronophila]
MPDSHLFGPLPSRRLGLSLGINLLPHKTCTEDCIYCECGSTTRLDCQRQEFVPLSELKQELKSFLETQPRLDFITFAGSGEPLLYSRFGELVDYLKEHWPQHPICLLTNGTLLTDRSLWAECKHLDLIVPSIDAASPEIFQRINRPAAGIDIRSVLSSLAEFSQQFTGEIWIEVLIVPGVNDSPSELQAIASACQSIRHQRIQLGTVDRPGAVTDLPRASGKQLQDIARHYFPAAQIVSRPEPGTTPSQADDTHLCDSEMEKALHRLLQVRPCTKEDLVSTIGKGKQRQVQRVLQKLEREGFIVCHKGFYRWCR